MENKAVGMAHEIVFASSRNQSQFSQMTMGQYWLGKIKPNKLSD